MAHPFIQHPKFGHIKVWAQSVGITVESGVTNGEPITIFTTEEGQVMPIVGYPDSEHVPPSFIGRIERRLGVITPFFSVVAP